MLGPSVILIGTPFSFGYSLFARALAPDRGFAYTAFGLSIFELVALLGLLIKFLIAPLMG
jgi:hypothetical protein